MDALEILILGSHWSCSLVASYLEKKGVSVSYLHINSPIHLEKISPRKRFSMTPLTEDAEKSFQWLKENILPEVKKDILEEKAQFYKNYKEISFSEAKKDLNPDSFFSAYWENKKFLKITPSPQDWNIPLKNGIFVSTIDEIKMKEGEIESIKINKNQTLKARNYLLFENGIPKQTDIFKKTFPRGREDSHILFYWFTKHEGSYPGSDWRVILDRREKYEPILGRFIKKSSTSYETLWVGRAPSHMEESPEDVAHWLHFVRRQMEKNHPESFKQIEKSGFYMESGSEEGGLFLESPIKNLKIYQEALHHDFSKSVASARKVTESLDL